MMNIILILLILLNITQNEIMILIFTNPPSRFILKILIAALILLILLPENLKEKLCQKHLRYFTLKHKIERRKK